MTGSRRRWSFKKSGRKYRAGSKSRTGATVDALIFLTNDSTTRSAKCSVSGRNPELPLFNEVQNVSLLAASSPRDGLAPNPQPTMGLSGWAHCAKHLIGAGSNDIG